MNTNTLSNILVEQVLAEVRQRLQAMPIPDAAPVKVAKSKAVRKPKADSKPAAKPTVEKDADYVTPESLLKALVDADGKWLVPTNPKRSRNTFFCIRNKENRAKFPQLSKVTISDKDVRQGVRAFRLVK